MVTSTTQGPETAQVLRGLALNREPGWNFPGNFLEISFDEVGWNRSRLSLEPGPHCLDAEGQVDHAAVCVLADIALAASLREQVGVVQRMATVQMSLSFTGAPLQGRLEAEGVGMGQPDSVGSLQLLAALTIRAGGRTACHGTASFLALGNKDALSPMPMLQRGSVPGAADRLHAQDLDDVERRVHERAVAAATGELGFLSRFWGLVPVKISTGAVCVMDNGMQVGNRVGHTQGGISLALAAATGCNCAGPGWSLTNVTGWYVAAGRGTSLRCEARTLHRGASIAVIECETRDLQGRLVLRAITTHGRSAL